MADVTLTSAVRDSLLSLQQTSDLISRTQNRLSSGLKVESVLDDPVAFFQAKSLNDRSSDFTEKKDGIDQGISTITAALDGVDGIDNLVRQLKGIANSMKSAESSQMSDLITQFNDLRTQINNLAADATYQGTNLINGSGTTLNIEFSEKTASVLNVASTDLRVGTAGLSIGSAQLYTGNFVVEYGTTTANYLATGSTSTAGLDNGVTTTGSLVLTFQGAQKSYTGGAKATFAFGTQTLIANLSTAVASTTVNNGDVLTLSIHQGGSTQNTAGFGLLSADSLNFIANGDLSNIGTALTAGDTVTLTWGGTTRAFTTADDTITFDYGTGTMVLRVGTGITGVGGGSLTAGETFTVTFLTADAGTGAGFYVVAGGVTGGGFSAVTAGTNTAQGVYGIRYGTATSVTSAFRAGTATQSAETKYVSAGDTTAINAVISELDTALTTLRTQSQTLGTNVALLNTRLDFTENYVNTLTGGASKLTLADINEEGANLLALQTRQQLGIQALAFAGQAEQSILALFQ